MLGIEFCSSTKFTANQINPGSNISPLIIAANLQNNIVPLMQTVKVVSLQKLVVKFNKRKSALKTLLISFKSKHFIYRKTRTNIAQKINVVQVSKPVFVIFAEGSFSIKTDKSVELSLNVLNIRINLLVRNHLTHFCFAGWITNSCSSAANKCNSVMSGSAQMSQCKKRNHMSNMQRRSGRITTNIKSNRSFIHQIRKSLLVRTLSKKTTFF